MQTQDPEVSDVEIDKAVQHLVTTKAVSASDDMGKVASTVADFLRQAKRERSVPEAVAGTAKTVAGGGVRGFASIPAAWSSLEDAYKRMISDPISEAVMHGLAKVTGGSQEDADRALNQARAMTPSPNWAQASADIRSDAAKVLPPDPHDVISSGAGHFLTTTAPEIAGQTVGIVASGPAAPFVGSTMYGGMSWQQAKDAGATDNQAAVAAMAGLGFGAVQAALLGKIALRSPNFLANSGALAGTNLAGEGVQDLVAKYSYDPERAIMAGWAENLAGSAVGAGVAHAMGAAGKPPGKAAAASEAVPAPKGAPEPIVDPAPPEAAKQETMRFTPETVEPSKVAAERLSEEQPPAPPAVVEPVPATGQPVEQAPQVPEPHGPFLLGKKAAVVLDDGRSIPVAYSAVEADQLTPSHDARRGFRPNDGGDVNERPYHDPTEGKPYRQTVEKIASKPNPALLHTDTPTALDGPPIVTDKGTVLGGNARTMAMQLAYERGGAQADLLRGSTHAAMEKFGIVGAEKLKNPVIVRVVQPGMEGEPGELSRSLNAALTTGRTPLTDAVSRGSKITPEAAGAIAGIVGEGSLREALGDPAMSKRVMRELVLTGAISDTDVVTMTDVRGLPTQAARDLIEHTLLGAVVPDVRSLAAAPASTKAALVRALPSLMAIETAWPGFKAKVALALDGIASLKASKLGIDDALRQTTIEPENWKTDPAAVAMVRAMEGESPTSIAARFQNTAEGVMDVVNGQSLMFFDQNERTVEHVFRLNMPEPNLPGTPQSQEVMQPIEQKIPELVGDSAPTMFQLHAGPEAPAFLKNLTAKLGEYTKTLGQKVSFSEQDVAQARPNPTSVAPELPLIRSASDLHRVTTLWSNRRHANEAHARIEAMSNHEKVKAIAGRRDVRQWLRETFGFDKPQAARQALEAAIDHRIELAQADPELIRKAAAQLTDPEFAPYAKDILASLDLPPEAVAIANRLRQEANTEGKRYQGLGLIENAKADYTPHLWEFKQGKNAPPNLVAKFAQKTGRMLQREFPTMLEGLLEMQRRKLAGEDYAIPKETSVVEKQRIAREQMGAVIENRNLVEQGIKSGILSDRRLADDWKLVDHPGFTKWLPVGKLVGGNLEVTPEAQQQFPGMENRKVIPEAEVRVWTRDLFVTKDGTVLMRKPLYAAPELGKRLNSILAKPVDPKDGIGHTFLHGADALRNFMLAYDYSVQAVMGMRSMLAMPGMESLRPIHAWKMGEQALRQWGPDIRLLVNSGLRLNVNADWIPKSEQPTGPLSKAFEAISRRTGAATYRAFQEEGRFGFKQMGANLKTRFAILELAAARKRNLSRPEKLRLSEAQMAEEVSRLANDVFTGQNLNARGRNPNAQTAARLTFIAPDWLESTLRQTVKTLPGNPAVASSETGRYIRTNARIVMRAYLASVLFHAMMASLSKDDTADKKREVWNPLGQGRKGERPFDADLTAAYDAAQGKEGGAKYLNLLAKMDDGYRLLLGGEQGQAWRSKLGILPSLAVDLLSGTTYNSQGFTTNDQRNGTEERGIHTKLTISPKTGKITIPGTEKGRDYSGHLSGPGLPVHPVNTQTLPSALGYEARGKLPIPAQSVVQWLQGETGWLDAVVSGLGIPTHGGSRKAATK